MDSQFYYKKDKLSQLRGFCTMVQTNSMIEAAKKIGVEPAAISKQIKSLERDIGLQLFYQELPKRKLILTEDGKKFYQKAIMILNEFDSLYKELPINIKNEHKKVIKISSHHTIIYYMLPIYIKEFQKINSEVEFQIYNIKFKESMKKILDNEIDITFHVFENIPPEFESIKLFDLKPRLLLNNNNPLAHIKDNKITFEILKNQNLIMLDRDNIINDFVNICNKNNLNSKINLINGDWESFRNFLNLDLGIHLYNSLYEKFEIFKNNNIVVKNVEHLFPSMNFQIMWKSGKIFNKELQEFINIVKKIK